MALPSVASLALPRPELPKAVLARPRRLTAAPPPEAFAKPLRSKPEYASVSRQCVTLLHPRHADVAPARALAAPCGALLEWY